MTAARRSNVESARDRRAKQATTVAAPARRGGAGEGRVARFSLLPRREQEWVPNVPLYGVSAWLAGADEVND